MEISVIIVNYNGLKYLQACLDSIHKKLHGITFEIIVFDNNSQDGSCNFLKSNFPEVILIESAINLGFGKANNAAVHSAKGKYLLFLNNDTILLDPIMPAMQQLESDDKIGAIGIYMIDGKGDYLMSCGNFPKVSNMAVLKNLSNLGAEFKEGKFSQSRYEVDWLSGAFLLMPATLYRDINGFDPEFFMYVEDVDICKRIADKGFKRIFFPGLKYRHFVGFNKKRNPMLIKGYEIYIRKHSSGIHKLLLTSALSINKLAKSFKNALKLD